MPVRKSLITLFFAIFAIQIGLPVRAGVLLQGFYNNVPSPAVGGRNVGWWWDSLASQANGFKQAGFSAIWIPPVSKGAAGGYSAGYDPFDDYDMGSKNQQGTTPTRFGTREQLERSVAMMRANGLDVYADIVDNHRSGDDGNGNFYYNDAYGNPKSGRFQKGPGDFHWLAPYNLPEDANVPECWAVQSPSVAVARQPERASVTMRLLLNAEWEVFFLPIPAISRGRSCTEILSQQFLSASAC